ncbi:response regulator transcription factor [Chitinophaga sancti]|uniref:DNA-binding response regulator, OmpR family, contains REC and winged-helix (WHTH) domain n=1 Tax=Chitinophaga sancti TaxID=1004 RepID=A0A1K1PDS0_9BACT|nr:response regulator transcription factor [Chitinophaga sancti]WQD65818.1 response regulator transcription factor [Chitinophaga sancti]WQG88560.1 response regulator transcription factor [Chitinophaga sancti]SFW45954.1 DNA-binding response regulator, OmpR family, contains REC and winged-helix (wHTH) domain [Chitinophaga sancti]
MESNVSILLAEDDYHYGNVVKKHLESQGYHVVHCFDGEVAWRKFQRDDFDLVILDVDMPKRDGFSLAQDIRKRNGMIPIIFVSTRSLDEDRLHGFRIGGDDFLVKPFSLKELVMRIRVFLRRTLPKEIPGDGIYRIGHVRFNYDEKELTREDGVQFAALTKKEAKVLKYLVENSNKLVKRDEILLKVWGNSSFFSSRSMDVFITRLRKHFKLEPGIDLETLHNVGIRLNIPKD